MSKKNGGIVLEGRNNAPEVKKYEETNGVTGLTYRELGESSEPWYQMGKMAASDHYLRPPDVGLRKVEKTFHQKYSTSMKNMIPIRCHTSSSVHPVDGAGLFSFATFSWLSSLMFKGFRHNVDIASLPPLSWHDSTEINAKRLQLLWEAELAKVGPEKASLGRVVVRFQRTRVLVDVLANITCMIFGALGPTVLIHNILQYSESGSTDLVRGIGLCVALFLTEITKVLCWSLAWAVNYRTAIRLKVAVSMVAFQRLLAFKTLMHTSVGEVIL